MNKDQPLTGVKKRKQIADARQQVFIWVALGSAVVVSCLMVAWNFIQRIQYQGSVNGEIAKAEKQLKNNISSISELQKNVDTLKSDKLLNKQNLKSDNSTVFQVVIDALPTNDDRTTLGASLQERILNDSGATIDGIEVQGDDQSTDTTSDLTSSSETTSGDGSSIYPVAKPITFKVTLKGDYNSIQKAMENIESAIRPIVINKVSIDGTENGLQATIDATTYYSSNVNYRTSQKEVKP